VSRQNSTLLPKGKHCERFRYNGNSNQFTGRRLSRNQVAVLILANAGVTARF
jgi:hypothetical protein